MGNKDILDEDDRYDTLAEAASNIDWKRKLTSRKFWLAVCAFVTLILIACGKTTEEAKQVAAIIMAGAAVIAYIFGEGLTDIAHIGEGEEYTYEEDEE